MDITKRQLRVEIQEKPEFFKDSKYPWICQNKMWGFVVPRDGFEISTDDKTCTINESVIKDNISSCVYVQMEKENFVLNVFPKIGSRYEYFNRM
jgi:hypothetical protein